MTKNKCFQKNFGDPPDRTSRPTFGSRPTVWETLLYWLPVASSCIQYKILPLVVRTQKDEAPKYICDLMRKPLSIPSLPARPLLSADRLDLLDRRTRTALAQHRVLLQWPFVVQRSLSSHRV